MTAVMFDRWTVVLVRPETPENIGLAARAMKNTGFRRLRLTGVAKIEEGAFRTAVHARDILNSAEMFEGPSAATADLNLVFAATAKARKNFSSVTLTEAAAMMHGQDRSTRIGLLFGNERTGLTSDELGASNVRFKIPQAEAQPSYNLAFAVLLTLYHIRQSSNLPMTADRPLPLPRQQQEECLELILAKLETGGFVHDTNRVHMKERVYDLFGRLAMTEADRRLLLALFGKGLSEAKRGRR